MSDQFNQFQNQSPQSNFQNQQRPWGWPPCPPCPPCRCPRDRWNNNWNNPNWNPNRPWR